MELLDFLEFIEYAKRHRDHGPRRYLRDHSDPFRRYEDHEFHARYGFTPKTAREVLLPLVNDFRKSSRRGLPHAPETMLLVALRYYATGVNKRLGDDVEKICQQSASRIVAQVSTLLASKMKHYVKFPTTVDGINQVKQKFHQLAGFPEVIGCIGCAHVKIKNPGGSHSELYKNDNGWSSLNVQAITGPNMEFYDVVPQWPGSTHNNHIYENSDVKHRLGTGILRGYILGDNTYSVSETLMTPFLSPNTDSQENFNKSLTRTRQTIEECFKAWKRRFPCLDVGMGIKKETVIAVIKACALLHNIAVLEKDFLPSNSNEECSEKTDNDICTMAENTDFNGFIERQTIVDRFFS